MNFTSLGRAGVALSAAALALLTGCSTYPPPTGTGVHFKGPVGIQLYSLREQFRTNQPNATAIVQGFGIHEVELAGLYNWKAEAFRDLLKGAGLDPVSGHFPYTRFKNDPDGIATEAKALGLKYAGCAWIDHAGPSMTPEEARAAAEVFEKAGAILAKSGIRCFYHCHGFEFVPDAAGVAPMDLLIRNTNPAHMTFEMDVVWVIYPNQNPAAWLRKYPGRWELMHLKDLRKGVATGVQTGIGEANDDVTLGTGQVNWPSVLAAAKKSGVKHYFIEDESNVSVTQIPATLKYLENISW